MNKIIILNLEKEDLNWETLLESTKETKSFQNI